MGVYSSNRSSSVGDIQVEAAEGYHGSVGVQLAMIEGFQNDLAVFDGAIMNDFREAGMVLEGASIEDLFAVQEASGSSFLETIKQFFVRLWAKIKGIFESFLAKFNSVVMKDSKAFHEKYAKTVYAKDLSKMKVKISKPKTALSTLAFSACAKTAGVNLDAGVLMDQDLTKTVEDFNREDFICKILNDSTPHTKVSEEKEYAKEVHELLFSEEEEQSGLSDTEIRAYGGILVKKDAEIAIKKSNASLNKAIGDMIKDIERSQTKVKGLLPYDGKDGKNTSGLKTNFGVTTNTEGESKNGEGYTHGEGSTNTASKVQGLQKALSYVQTQAGCIQSAALKFTEVTLAETKFEIAQARRVFAAAVAHNEKSVKESVELSEAMQEAANFEVMSSFECY